jgi:hypothetical protein
VPRPAPRRWAPLALAASVAALLAAPLGYWVGRDAAEPAGALRDALAGARPLVAAALENTPSGDTLSAAGFRVQPLSTHPVAGGACRDFLLDGPGGALVGLGCREGNGWALRVGVALEGGAAIRPAAADHPLIGAMLDRLSAEPPLDAAAEAALMRRGWR